MTNKAKAESKSHILGSSSMAAFLCIKIGTWQL
ncbi:hypothetical protein T03_3893 [Trichinella britovi]|uniref:Uncharacterized protein n=1 Tax=Trichinella britovi TaxID=45882 RepID=A0A0V1C312_TRIBR|nr:hypothetical protein T03_3893 [Trichinella britovi]